MKWKWIIGLVIIVFIIGFVAGFYYGVNTKSSKEKLPEGNMQGTVTQIIDGDTLVVDGTTIRLALVDAPERGEVGFIEATKFAASVCPVGSIAYVDVDDGQPRDNYGRTVALVYCGGKNLNAELWKNGYAQIDERFLSVSEFNPHSW